MAPVRALSSFPPRFAEIFHTALTLRVKITMDNHEDALRLRWRLQKFRAAHPLTHEARLLSLSVRRNILIIHRRDVIPPSRIEETPQ